MTQDGMNVKYCSLLVALYDLSVSLLGVTWACFAPTETGMASRNCGGHFLTKESHEEAK